VPTRLAKNGSCSTPANTHQFLTTPRQGIRETFLSASAKIEKAQLLAEYHQLKSDTGGIDFGDEFDLGVSYPLMQKLIGKLEFADYKAGDSTSGVSVRAIPS
jgi:hypothetical protein